MRAVAMSCRPQKMATCMLGRRRMKYVRIIEVDASV